MPVVIPRPLAKPALHLSADFDDVPAFLAASNDGRFLAIASCAGEVMICDLLDSTRRWSWQAHIHGLCGMSWHPSRHWLTTAGQDGYARIWDIAGENPTRLVREHAATSDWVEHASWSPDGCFLAYSAGKTVSLFNEKDSSTRTLLFDASTVQALQWRPKGTQLAIAGYGGVDIHNPLDPHASPRRFRWKGSMITLRWNPEGTIIAAGCQDNTLHFWRMRDGSDSQMRGFSGKPSRLTWSGSGRWLTSTGSSDIIGWCFKGFGPEGKSPVVNSFHPEPLTDIEFARKGDCLASASRDGRVCVWPEMGAREPSTGFQMNGSVEALCWVRASRLNRLAASSQSGTILVVDV
jgi:WD40 repeat protein